MPIEYDVGCRSLIYGLYYVEVCTLYSHFAECFIINGCCTLSNAFSASIDMSLWFLSFLLFMWCIMFIDLRILYHPWNLGMHPTWSWCMSLLMCCWIQFASILLRILASVFIRDIGLYFLSLLCFYLVLGLGWTGFIKSLGVFPLLGSFGLVWEG